MEGERRARPRQEALAHDALELGEALVVAAQVEIESKV
jgi:hypothetical protein